MEATDEFANNFITKAIMANSNYEGYPVATSMTRQLIARKVAEFAVANGCDAISEGSTGKGNDQYRMHNVFNLFAPDLKVIVPVRDFNWTREEEKKLSAEYGIPYKAGIDKMSEGLAVSFFAPDEHGHEVRFALAAYTTEKARELAEMLRGDSTG